jgi:hypothetical protein
MVSKGVERGSKSTKNLISFKIFYYTKFDMTKNKENSKVTSLLPTLNNYQALANITSSRSSPTPNSLMEFFEANSTG